MPPLTLRGVVTKVGFMNKTATVTVTRWVEHSRTQKRLQRRKKYLTHDPENKLRQDDEVIIQHCPPVSARKRFTLFKIVKSQEGGEVHDQSTSQAGTVKQGEQAPNRSTPQSS